MEGIGEALVTCTAGGAWWQISKANCHLQALVQFQRGEAAQFVCFFFRLDWGSPGTGPGARVVHDP